MIMADNFESRFFDLLQKNLDDLSKQVSNGFQGVNKKVDNNTKLTNALSKRVDKIDGKVFKKQGSIGNLIQDRQIVFAFLFALMVFLLILANALHVKVPTL